MVIVVAYRLRRTKCLLTVNETRVYKLLYDYFQTGRRKIYKTRNKVRILRRGSKPKIDLCPFAGERNSPVLEIIFINIAVNINFFCKT
jgi:hypothetical protein